MIRIEKDDFKPGKLSKLAKACRMNTSEFKKRFSYLV